MKKFYCSFYAAVLFVMVACSNESTAPESAASTPAPVTTTPAATTPPATPPPAKADADKVVVKQTEAERTTISIGTSGGSVKTKAGTEVGVSDKGVNVGTKDVKIDIKRDSN